MKNTEKIKEKIEENKKWLETLCEGDADKEEWYNFVTVIHKEVFGEGMRYTEFDNAWQWRDLMTLYPYDKEARDFVIQELIQIILKNY